MTQLPKEFSRRGMFFRQMERKGSYAIYRVDRAQSKICCGYEVIHIRTHNGYSLGGNQIPPGEYYPSSEEWGRHAWSYLDIKEAKRKLTRLLKAASKVNK